VCSSDLYSYISGGFVEYMPSSNNTAPTKDKMIERVPKSCQINKFENTLKLINRIIPQNGNTAPTKDKMIEWAPKSYQINKFENTLKLIKEKEIKLILVQAPVTSTVFNKYKEDKSIDSYFSEKGEYYNFNYLINMNDNLHFSDGDHLNQNGVKIFNEALIKNILKQMHKQLDS
jgi:hypothetical protein